MILTRHGTIHRMLERYQVSKKLLLVITTLIVIEPACIHRSTTPNKKIPVSLRQRVWRSVEHEIDVPKKDERGLSDQLAHEISCYDAIGIALRNNKRLQAYWDRLGIARADLEQSGLFTNPTVSTVFRVPTKGDRNIQQINIESDLLFNVTDLWQVPLKKRVANDVVELVTVELFAVILDIVQQTVKAYGACLYANVLRSLVNDQYEVAKELLKEVHYEQHFGLTTQADKYMAQSHLLLAKQKKREIYADYIKAFQELRLVLGIVDVDTPLILTGTLKPCFNKTFLLEDLLPYAIENNPALQIVQIKTQQLRHEHSLEQARLFKSIRVGPSYKRDFEKPAQGWGVQIQTDLPVFDTNYAQVEKVEAQLSLAQREYELLISELKTSLSSKLIDLRTLTASLKEYQDTILPIHTKSVMFADVWADTGQLSSLDELRALKELLHATQAFWHMSFEWWNTHANLERLIGGRLAMTSKRVVC